MNSAPVAARDIAHYTIHASRDPAQILKAVDIWREDLDRYETETEFQRQRVAKHVAESSWATFPALTGFQPLVILNRAHHVIATGDWPFLEDRFRQMEAQLLESKDQRGGRKSLALHIAASDGRWFTVSAPSGEVAWGRPGDKKARPAFDTGMRFAWLNGHLVLAADTRSSARKSLGRSFIARAQDHKGEPSPADWDGIKALCEAACAVSPDSLAAFGKLTGICAVCGRSLTDKLSKQRGIGPVCWEQVMGSQPHLGEAQ